MTVPTAVRQYLPAPYQDVLDFAYYSGWRKREILGLRWDEVDEPGGVVRLSPARSKTRVGPPAPDLAADRGGVVPPTGEASPRGPPGLYPRRDDGAGVASRLAGGVSAGGRPWAVAA